MRRGERRLAAIMFTDVVGFTALSQKDEDMAMRLLEEHRNLVRPCFRKHGGRVVKTMGDAFLTEFSSALEAVRCAFDMQQALHEFYSNRAPGERVSIRVGVHVGDVIEDHGDVYGDAVNVASRIEPLALPGGVCISRQVRDNIAGKFQFPLASMGVKELKNVAEPTEVYSVVLPWEEGVEDKVELDGRRVAILPFANFSPDPSDGYFADGITDEIISTVAGISGLSVISRTSVMGYKGTTKKMGEIGRELGVGSVLEGSFKKSGDRIRVTTQLIDVVRDRHLWLQNYDRDLDDVFAVQSDIAKQVADALRVKLLSREAERLSRRPTENIDAYVLYLKGTQFWVRRSKESVDKAIEYYSQAIEMDPKFALAYAGLGLCYGVLSSAGYMNEADAAEKAKPAVAEALRLDSGLADAHAALGWIRLEYDWDWDASEAEFRRAIELKPNHAAAHQWYSSLLLTLGRFDECLAEAEAALELDPLAPMTSYNLGATLAYMGRHEEAIEHVKRCLEIEPDFVPSLGEMAYLSAQGGRYEEAFSWLERWARFTSATRVTAGRAWILAKAGRTDEALRTLDLAITAPEFRDERLSVEVASTFALLHDEARALEWLERALELHDSDVTMIARQRGFGEYRSKPRFQAIVRKLRLEGDQTVQETNPSSSG